MARTVYSFDILIARCLTCKGLVEVSPSDETRDAFIRHLGAVHNIEPGAASITLEIPEAEPKSTKPEGRGLQF
jgi:hypothetical protein